MSFRGRNSTKVLLPFGLEYADVANGFDTEKPTLTLPVHNELTSVEKDSATQTISFQQRMRDGTFYTGSLFDASEDFAAKGKKRTNTQPDGIERYSDRYKKVKKIGKTIKDHPYQLEFFPQELYSVMGVTGKQKKKMLDFSTFKSNGGLKNFDKATDSDILFDKLNNVEETEEKDEKDEDASEEEVDDEFEEDDDDDYNAEKYFDDGDEDAGDDDGDEAAF